MLNLNIFFKDLKTKVRLLKENKHIQKKNIFLNMCTDEFYVVSIIKPFRNTIACLKYSYS